MSDRKTPSVSWFFLVKWILANSLGWGLGWEVSWVMGFLISIFITQAVAYVLTGDFIDEIGFGPGWIFISLTWGLIGGIYGTMIGTLQWLVLRRYLAHSGWWVLATAGSLALLFVVDVTITISVSDTLNQATFGQIIKGSWPNGLSFVILWPIISFFTWSDNFISLI